MVEGMLILTYLLLDPYIGLHHTGGLSNRQRARVSLSYVLTSHTLGFLAGGSRPAVFGMLPQWIPVPSIRSTYVHWMEYIPTSARVPASSSKSGHLLYKLPKLCPANTNISKAVCRRNLLWWKTASVEGGGDLGTLCWVGWNREWASNAYPAGACIDPALPAY